MAPKMAPAKVSEVVPTKAEDEEATRILAAASKEKKHSIVTAMGTFTKANPDAVATLAEGALKEKYIKHYTVLQIRAKASTKKMLGSRNIESGKTTHIDTVPWNKHKIYKEMGEFKGDLFMSILPPQPCRLSLSTHEEAVEYNIPLQWSRFTHSDMQQLRLQSENDAKPEDMETMNALAELGGSSASTTNVAVKVEPKTPEDLAAETQKAQMLRVKSLRDDPATLIRKYQDLKIDVTRVKAKSDQKKTESKYASRVSKDSETVLEAIALVLPSLEKILVKTPTDKTIITILEAVDALDHINDDLQQWASRLGFATSTKIAGKRKRKDPEVNDW
jgi:hypothetical protein